MAVRLTGSRRTFTSTRSSSGPDSRPRYRRRAAGLQSQPAPPESALAQGHGLAARTRVNRAGNRVIIALPRDDHLPRL